MPNLFNPRKFNHTFFETEYTSQEYSQCIMPINCPVNNSNLNRTLINRDNQIYFKLEDRRKRLCGILRLRKEIFNNQIYYVVERAYTNHIHRNKGVIAFLYQYIVQQNFKIISDSTHTLKGSMNIWKRMPAICPNNQIWIYNIETKYKRKYIDQSDYTIWGKEENIDFDTLELDDKKYLIETMKDSREISTEQFNYFITGIKTNELKDCKNIRITVE